MTSTTQTLQAHDFPFSFETLWNIDFSNVGAYPQDSTSEVMDLGVEELSSKFANEETQEPPTEDSQETKKTSLALSGTGHPTIDIGGSSMEQTSTPLIQACPDRAGEIAAEAQIIYLRHKLQKGLLTKGQLPKEENIHEMSSYLGKLEGLGSPPGSAISNTKICKVLKSIKNLKEIPRDDELHIKKRAENLLDKWKPILDAQPKVINSPQPEVIDLTGEAEEAEEVEPIEAPQPEATDLKEESEEVELMEAPQPEATELTEGLADRLPHPDEDRRNELDALREDVAARSPSIHYCKGAWNTTPCDNSSPKRDSTSSTLKRKFSDAASDSETTASGSGTSAKVRDERPTNRRPKRKTPVKNYVRKESLWMKDTLNGIEELLEENNRQNDRLLEFQKRMQSWGTEDEKITKEWEQSS